MEFNDTALRQAVQNACPGEQILWVGKPSAGFRFAPTDWLAVPFTLLWGVLVLRFPVGPFMSGELPFYVVPLIFKAVAVYVIIGRFFADMYRRSRTIYGLTDRSAVIITSVFGTSTRVVDLHAVPEIALEGGAAGGEGSIAFGTPLNSLARNGLRNWGAMPHLPTFEYIAGAAAVYQQALTAHSGKADSQYQVVN